MLTVVGCERTGRSDSGAVAERALVVYCSVDEVFAKGVLQDFQNRTGVAVRPAFDSEAGKTTGLIQRIVAEADAGRPRGDVLWSSEVFNTIQLARRGLLESYESPVAADIPERFRDPGHRWTGVSVRARALAFDPKRVNVSELPTQWQELAQSKFAGRTAMANPLFGTTRGHVAAMFAMWGPEAGRRFLHEIREGGVRIVDGNSAAVRALIAGQVEFAMTDTDDVWVAQRAGASIDLRYLDMGAGGTLVIPCTVAIIKGGPNGTLARQLVDYLLSADAERMLAQSDSRNVPVREALRKELGMDWSAESVVDYPTVTNAMEESIAAVRDILIR